MRLHGYRRDDDSNTAEDETWDEICDATKDARSIVIHGAPGVGKRLLANQILTYLRTMQGVVEYLYFEEMGDEWKESSEYSITHADKRVVSTSTEQIAAWSSHSGVDCRIELTTP